MTDQATSDKHKVLVRISTEKTGEQIFKMIIKHPMETGYRRDNKTLELIPADYIEQLRISLDGVTCFEAALSENIAKDPFLYFTFNQPVNENAQLIVNWSDNLGKEYSENFSVEKILRESAQARSAATVVPTANVIQKPTTLPSLDTVARPVCNKPFGNRQDSKTTGGY